MLDVGMNIRRNVEKTSNLAAARCMFDVCETIEAFYSGFLGVYTVNDLQTKFSGTYVKGKPHRNCGHLHNLQFENFLANIECCEKVLKLTLQTAY